MQRKSFAEMECPIAQALEEVGDGWSLLVLRTAFLGVTFFAEFEQRLGIPASTLTRRLEALCERGLLERRTYASRPPRDKYVLTEKGRDFLPVILSLAKWGSRWLAPEGGPPLVAVDAESGKPIDAMLVDAKTRRPLVPGGVALVPGPSASPRLRRAMPEPIVLGGERASHDSHRGD
jgi:DNA-binding HxlR family transcriptional regulator